MTILELDEVGRGPWAGPLVMGAVILPKNKAKSNAERSEKLEKSVGEEGYPEWVGELADSKKLSKKKRERLSETILREASATGLGWVTSKELDEMGLSAALKLAARRAVEAVREKNVAFTEIVIDGTINFLEGTSLEKYVTVLPKADSLIKEVSAASIIAKVARDRYMEKLAEKYPQYGFEKHVGYGTAAHKKALENFGTCEEHRKSFRPVMEIMLERGEDDKKEIKSEHANDKRKTTKEIGDAAEEKVALTLEAEGHEIIARNYKTKFYEIDIVSVYADKIYFTEVKYRKSQKRGTSMEMITPKKLEQMKFAAEAFLKKYPAIKQKYSPMLAGAAVTGEDFVVDEWMEIK